MAKKGYVLYNLKAGRGITVQAVRQAAQTLGTDLEFIEISDVQNYRAFFSALDADDFIVLCGGDGTLNRFANAVDGLSVTQEIYHCPLGTGNDFSTDVQGKESREPFCISPYLKNLPVVTVKGKRYRFLNGVGYGIDGYCCEEGDRLRESGKTNINYTLIAIKGLLFAYRPTNARITIDGVTTEHKRVWLAPTMNGRYYGGGMMPTPDQSRTGTDKTLSLLLFSGASALRTLLMFPSIFKGEHIKYDKYVHVFTGKSIRVEYDRPVALQIDGETILGVTSYEAVAEDPVPVN